LVLRAYEYYPNNYRLYSIKTGLLQNISYTYDSVGNVTGITDYLDWQRTQSFSYDELNRLRYATSQSYNTIEYQYDQIGNITYNSRIGSYTYGDTKHIHAVTQAGNYTYSYDANGNMTTRNEKTITYDYDNRATSITGESSTVTNVYDYSGQRIKKTVGSSRGGIRVKPKEYILENKLMLRYRDIKQRKRGKGSGLES
jgi:YD repeat-containing protein